MFSIGPRLHFVAAALAALFIGAHATRAQQAADKNVPASDGWASSWTQPVTPQERSEAEFKQRLAAASRTGHLESLLAECTRAAHDAPDDLVALEHLANVHLAMKRYDACMDDAKRAEDTAGRIHAPSRAVSMIHYEIAQINLLRGRYAEAAGELESVVKAERSSFEALNCLAWLRATNPDPRQRNGREAVELARRALQIVGANDFSCVDTLAAAYAETGDFTRAQTLEKEAIASAKKRIGHDAEADAFAKTDAAARLELYTHNKPYHETPHLPPS